jgi:hypothetical protein
MEVNDISKTSEIKNSTGVDEPNQQSSPPADEHAQSSSNQQGGETSSRMTDEKHNKERFLY